MAPISENKLTVAEDYGPLFETLDLLAAKLGSKGTFYLNDLDSQSVDFAAARLQEYAKARGLDHITSPLLNFPATFEH